MKHSVLNWIARRIVALASPLVPRWRREQWRETWDAELYHGNEGAPVVRRSTGAVSHAAWLRARDWSRDGVLQDVRYGVRSLRKQPGFTAVALLVLTLAIGANTTIFSLVNGMLFRPLGGVEAPEQLVGVWRAREGQSPDVWSYPNYEDIRAMTDAFAGVVTYTTWGLTLRQDAALETIAAQMVSRDFFEVLGVDMARGVGLGATPQTADVVVSHGAWQRRFGGRTLIGETIELNGLPLQVVGIAGPGFLGLDRSELPEIWMALDLEMMLDVREQPSLRERGWSWLRMVARLTPGTTLPQARASAAVTTELLKEHAVNRDVSTMLVPHNGLAPQDTDEAGQVFAMLMVIVGLLLLIACANVANLLLARARTRGHEYGVRLALGASRGRLVRQLLVESLVLAMVATAAGIVVSQWSTGLLIGLFENMYDTRFSVVITPDVRVLGFSAGIAALCVVVFGLVPALRAARTDAAPLISTTGGGAGWKRGWFSNALVVGQVALSLLVLVTAGLFVRSMKAIQNIDPGFDAAALLTVTPLDLEPAGGTAANDEEAWRDLLVERLKGSNRVEAVAWSEFVPLGGGVGRRSVATTPGDVENSLNLGTTGVSPGYFRTIGLPLLSGRDFAESDGPNGATVVIVNDTLAQQLWPGEPAVGKTLYFGSAPIEVIGVAAGARYFALTEPPQPYFYTALSQTGRSRQSLLIRAAGPPAELIGQVHAAIGELPGTIVARNLSTLPERIASTYGSQRAFAEVVGMFGVLALVLAVAGAYGVTSYLVTRRTVEIGIRVALGAPSGRVMGTVMRQTAVLGILGVGLGVALARAATPALAGLIEGVDPTDTPTFAFVAVMLLASVALAGLIPARRAARVDPLIALKQE